MVAVVSSTVPQLGCTANSDSPFSSGRMLPERRRERGVFTDVTEDVEIKTAMIGSYLVR